MEYLIEFFHKKAPTTSTEMPAYYRRALMTCDALLAVYFPLIGLLLWWVGGHFLWTPFAMFAATLCLLPNIKKLNMRLNLAICAGIIFFWCAWYVHTIGWNNGSQPLLLILLVLVAFDICEGPWMKIGCFVLLFAFRMALYAYSLNHEALITLERTSNLVFQSVNSATVYLILAAICILFSTNIQDAERQLRLDNQELSKEAGTDPLTQLPNRRVMLDEMKRFMAGNPDEYLCVAIADIDYFKRVNDTYGHACGDYTLCRLSDLFREKAGARYRACRWGGEEFCFFLPGMNMDAAGREMVDLNIAVSRMKLSFEGNEFSITITIGVGEYDFRSPIEDIIENADQKLYMGKERGRNQVVI